VVRGEVEIDARTLKETRSELNSADQQTVQRQVLGPEVLDVAKHPVIRFTARGVTLGEGEPKALRGELTGDLSLHGVERSVRIPIQVSVRGDTAHVSGEAVFNQSEFGIKPMNRMLGAVQVQDRVTVDLVVALVREEPGR
jgi:polyisoprenoid-binding protein YceI